MLPEVNEPNSKPFSAVEQVGIAIKQTEPDQRHVGLLYQIDGEPLKICHLAFHHDFRSDLPDSSYSWLQASLEEFEKPIVASAIAAIVRENPANAFTYALGYDSDRPYFDPNTFRFLRGQLGDGLSCATFVIAVFETLGFQLLDKASYGSRPDDTSHAEKLISRMEMCCPHPDVPKHVEELRKKPITTRFRPEEVAAGASCSDSPLSFDRAVTVGEFIVAELQRQIPSAEPPPSAAEVLK